MNKDNNTTKNDFDTFDIYCFRKYFMMIVVKQTLINIILKVCRCLDCLLTYFLCVETVAKRKMKRKNFFHRFQFQFFVLSVVVYFVLVSCQRRNETKIFKSKRSIVGIFGYKCRDDHVISISCFLYTHNIVF